MEDFYRGKRLDNGKWVYGGLIKTLEGYFIYPDDAKCGLVTVKDGRLSLYPDVPEIKTVEDFKNYVGNFEIVGSLHDEEKIVEQAIELAKALNIQNTTKAMEYEFNYRKNKLFTITRQITL